MKQSPQLGEVQALMAPGALTREGFLGEDARTLIEILNHDDNTVATLGFTHEELGAAMAHYTGLALAAMGAPAREEHICVTGFEAMGQMPCPFAHAGLFPKAVIKATREDSGQSMQWAALSAHLIGEHGFYGGEGSVFRVDPEKAGRFFGLI